jgi:protein phosphatase PTC6
MPIVGLSRDTTVVRIPLQSAKHHYGSNTSRGSRPYNEDALQAGVIEFPAFAKKAPLSLTRSRKQPNENTAAESATGDPQVFYFGVFDGHGGSDCSAFLRKNLHDYIEQSAKDFNLRSTLGKKGSKMIAEPTKPRPGSKTIDDDYGAPESPEEQRAKTLAADPAKADLQYKQHAQQLQTDLVNKWRETVGGYFRRFRPEHFSVGKSSLTETSGESDSVENVKVDAETVLMYAFLKADYDFVTTQASKPEKETESESPLNANDVLGEPSKHQDKLGAIGAASDRRFTGGSTCSIAIISTPTPMPFWHPSSIASLLVSHVGDTRILICFTATGEAKALTTDHHPSSPGESRRLRRYAGTFVTDSFGEERMSGLANTRAFGDFQSKRIGVSAEPELRLIELGAAEYSFLVLISDGISGTVSDQEVVDIVKEAKTPEQAAKDVVTFATEVSTEGDNATCMVVRLGGWERRGEGGVGSMGTKEMRDWRLKEAQDPRSRRS